MAQLTSEVNTFSKWIRILHHARTVILSCFQNGRTALLLQTFHLNQALWTSVRDSFKLPFKYSDSNGDFYLFVVYISTCKFFTYLHTTSLWKALCPLRALPRPHHPSLFQARKSLSRFHCKNLNINFQYPEIVKKSVWSQKYHFVDNLEG